MTKFKLAVILMTVALLNLSSCKKSDDEFNCNKQFNPPAFDNGTLFLVPDILTESDPSTFESIAYKGRDSRVVYDRRVSDQITINAYLFTVKFEDGLSSEVQVNPEFSSEAEATKQATKYAKAIGLLPKVLRKDIATITIHKGEEQFGGGNQNILIYSEAADYNNAVLEETLIHEAVHTSLDPYHDNDEWRKAQCEDDRFISPYADDYPNREDIAESFVLYFAVKYKSDRISESMKKTIESSIPNRIKYFDSQNFDMHPY